MTSALDRRLGPVDAAAIVVSNVIGGGIFFVPILVAQLVPDPRGMLLVWLVGGALAFTGAMAYAELAALRPLSGGEYVYLREAFGPLAAFLTGWTSFVAGFSGAIAASAQSVWSGLLMLSGRLAQLVSYTGFALVLFAGVAVSAVFVLRRRNPEAPRPFRAWGYPWAPVIFVAACAVMVVNELFRNPGTSAAGLAIIAAGSPIYWWMTADSRSALTSQQDPE